MDVLEKKLLDEADVLIDYAWRLIQRDSCTACNLRSISTDNCPWCKEKKLVSDRLLVWLKEYKLIKE